MWSSSHSKNPTSQDQFSILTTFLGAREEGVFGDQSIMVDSVNGLSLTSPLWWVVLMACL